MRDDQITSPEELDAAMAGSAMHKSEKLWKTAEGRLFRWPDLIALIGSSLLILVGLYGVFAESAASASLLFLIFGLSFFGGQIYRHQQSQIDALRELVKQMNHRGSR